MSRKKKAIVIGGREYLIGIILYKTVDSKYLLILTSESIYTY